MTEELREKIVALLWNPPTTEYASTYGGTYIDTDREAQADQILALIKEAGYAQIMPHKKRPDLIITDEQAGRK